MQQRVFPVIDPVATGRNILRLRKAKGLSVRDIQAWFNFEEPRSVYKWQTGQTLPSVDNLYALSALFEVPMDSIIIGISDQSKINELQAESCSSSFSAHIIFCIPAASPPGCGIFLPPLDS